MTVQESIRLKLEVMDLCLVLGPSWPIRNAAFIRNMSIPWF